MRSQRNRKATISFVVSVRLSVRMEQIGSHWKDFYENLIIVRKSVEKIQVPLKSEKNDGYFTWRPIQMFWSYLHQFFLECEMFRTKIVEKIKTHILSSIILFTKVVPFTKHSAKNCRAETLDDITWHKHSACWITNATNTHSEYVILVVCPWQKWLRELASFPLFFCYTEYNQEVSAFSPRHFKPDIWFLLWHRRTMLLIHGGATIFRTKVYV